MAEEKIYGFAKEGAVYRNAFLNFPERQIGEVKESEEESLSYFTERFGNMEAQVNDLEQRINEATNKGSFLMKIRHLKKVLPETDAIGDFESLYRKLTVLEEQIEGSIAINRAKNLEIKKALLQEVEVVAGSNEWKSATEQLKTLQGKWMKTGAVAEEHKEAIEGKYQDLVTKFYERRAEFYADLEKMQLEKEELYQEFLAKAQKQLEAAEFTALKKLNAELTEEWKGLGRIKREKQNAYWKTFQGYMNTAWERGKAANKKVKKTDKTANKKDRSEFIEKLRVMNQELLPEVDLAVNKKEWKGLGSVDRKEMHSLHQHFQEQYEMLSEKQFLEQLVSKKLRGKADDKQRKDLRFRLLRDLLDRDKRELRAFKDNLDKFNTTGGFEKMISGKLELQERKVRVKQSILDQLKSAK